MRWPDWFDDARRRVERLLRDEPGDPAWLRIARQHLSVTFRDQVLRLAGQAFMAIVPLLVVVAALLGETGIGVDLGGYFVDHFDLSGSAAESMRVLFMRPPEAASGVSVVSVLIVLFSVTSFSRALRRYFDASWGLPTIGGLRGSAFGLAGVLLLVGAMATVIWLTSLTGSAGVSPLVVLPIQLAVAVVGWAAVLRLLLVHRVAWHRLWRGAAYGAVAHVAAGVASNLYLPGLIGRNSERYGVIGAAVALLWWLVILAAVIASVGVVSAELGRDGASKDGASNDGASGD